jgi:hypothetical protein
MDLNLELHPTNAVFLLIFAVVLLIIILRNQLVADINLGNNRSTGADFDAKRRWKFAFLFGIIFFTGVSLLIVLVTLGLTISLAYQGGEKTGDILRNLIRIFPLFLSLNALLIAPLAPFTLIIILIMYFRSTIEGNYWLDRIWKNPRISDRERHW